MQAVRVHRGLTHCSAACLPVTTVQSSNYCLTFFCTSLRRAGLSINILELAGSSARCWAPSPSSVVGTHSFCGVCTQLAPQETGVSLTVCLDSASTKLVLFWCPVVKDPNWPLEDQSVMSLSDSTTALRMLGREPNVAGLLAHPKPFYLTVLLLYINALADRQPSIDCSDLLNSSVVWL